MKRYVVLFIIVVWFCFNISFVTAENDSSFKFDIIKVNKQKGVSIDVSSVQIIQPEVIQTSTTLLQLASPSLAEELANTPVLNILTKGPKYVTVQVSSQPTIPEESTIEKPIDSPKEESTNYKNLILIGLFILGGIGIYFTPRIYTKVIIPYLHHIKTNNTKSNVYDLSFMYIPVAALAKLKLKLFVDTDEDHHIFSVTKTPSGVTFYFVKSFDDVEGMVITNQNDIDGEISSYIYLQKVSEELIYLSADKDEEDLNYVIKKFEDYNKLTEEELEKSPIIKVPISDNKYLIFDSYENQLKQGIVFVPVVIDTETSEIVSYYYGFVAESPLQITKVRK